MEQDSSVNLEESVCDAMTAMGISGASRARLASNFLFIYELSCKMGADTAALISRTNPKKAMETLHAAWQANYGGVEATVCMMLNSSIALTADRGRQQTSGHIAAIIGNVVDDNRFGFYAAAVCRLVEAGRLDLARFAYEATLGWKRT